MLWFKKHPSMTATWNIVVTRKDGTRLPLSSQSHDRDPSVDATIIAFDDDGHQLKARLVSFRRNPPNQADLGIWQVEAVEI
jgi:hypothetical protein